MHNYLMTVVSVIASIAAFAHPERGLQAEAIPEHIVKINAYQTISMLAAVLHGKNSPYFAKIKKPTGEVVSQAAYLATLSMFYDFDDFMFAGHTGHSSVLLPLVFAAETNISGKEFITLQTLANEIGARLGASLFFGPHNGQMWSTIHQFNAGLVVGRLRAHHTAGSPSVIVETISRAMAYPVYALFDSFFSSSAKIFTASASLAAGLTAALAAEGVSGPDLLREDSDFYRVFSYAPLAQVWKDLGERWYSQSLSIKKYPGCAYIGGPVEACRNLYAALQEQNLYGDAIEELRVECNMLSKKMNDLATPHLKGAASSLTTLNFSLPVNCAAMLVDGNITPETFRAESLARSELWALADRVHVVHDIEATRMTMQYSSLLDDASALVFMNLPRLGPYAKRMGGIRDAMLLPFEVGFSLMQKNHYPRHGLVEPHVDYRRYRFLNPARVTAKLRSGKKLVASSLNPPGFAGTDSAEMESTVLEKLAASGIDAASVEKIRAFVFTLGDRNAAEMKSFSEWFMQLVCSPALL